MSVFCVNYRKFFVNNFKFRKLATAKLCLVSCVALPNAPAGSAPIPRLIRFFTTPYGGVADMRGGQRSHGFAVNIRYIFINQPYILAKFELIKD